MTKQTTIVVIGSLRVKTVELGIRTSNANLYNQAGMLHCVLLVITVFHSVFCAVLDITVFHSVFCAVLDITVFQSIFCTCLSGSVR